MKCTLKIFLEHFNESLPWGWGLSAMQYHFTCNPGQAFQDQKHMYKNNIMKRYISHQSFKCV